MLKNSHKGLTYLLEVQCSFQIATNLTVTIKVYETDASFQVSKTPLNKDHLQTEILIWLHFG